jgi:hypothetical protein
MRQVYISDAQSDMHVDASLHARRELVIGVGRAEPKKGADYYSADVTTHECAASTLLRTDVASG